LSGTLAPKIT